MDRRHGQLTRPLLARPMTGQDLTIAAGAVAKTRILSVHSTVKEETERNV